MKKCLVVTCGFFGDIIFASSLAEKLKQEKGYESVDYLIGFPQMETLVRNNPFIDNVFVSEHPNATPTSKEVNTGEYEKVYQLQPLSFKITPCEEFQQLADLSKISSEYRVYTQQEYDIIAEQLINDLKQEHKKPVVAVMSNWQSKTYIFTPEQYIAGVDVPGLGYGGAHRNVQEIVEGLSDSFTLLQVGAGNLSQIQTANTPDHDTKSLLFEASLIKYCDAFIGTDGGLATIAAGVGTKTVLTGDFNLQLYGWNGVIKKIEQPRLGPYEYFGAPHIVLDPYLTDTQVISQIISELL